MAENKIITELTELTTVDDADVLAIVDDPGGSPVTKKITRANLVANILLPFKKLTASDQAAGNLNLSDASNWGISLAMITRIKVTLASGTTSDFDIAIYEKDDFGADTKLYESKGFSTTDTPDVLIGSLAYQDQDDTDELHMKITDNDGTGNPLFNIEIRGYSMSA